MFPVETSESILNVRKEELTKMVRAVIPALAVYDSDAVGYGYGSFFAFLNGRPGVRPDHDFSHDSDADIIIFPQRRATLEYESGVNNIIHYLSVGWRKASLIHPKIIDPIFLYPGSDDSQFIDQISKNWVLLFKDGKIYF